MHIGTDFSHQSCIPTDPYNQLDQLKSMSQQWKCKLLFNENPASSKTPKFVDLMNYDGFKEDRDYVFPQRFHGIASHNQIIVELQLAAIQAGFNLKKRTSKSKKELGEF